MSQLYSLRANATLQFSGAEFIKAAHDNVLPFDDVEVVKKFHENIQPAINDIEKAIQLAPGDRYNYQVRFDILKKIATNSDQKETWENALGLITQLIQDERIPEGKSKLLVKKVNFHVDRALVSARKGRHQEALDNFESAIATDESYYGYKMRALYWRKLGRDDLAKEDEQEVRARGGVPFDAPH